MSAKKPKQETEKDGFLEVLEQGVRDVLKDKETTPAEKMAAINAGSKLLAIRHKITDGNDDSFFGSR